MAETGAVFGGEHSAHYYFRDFWGADTGMLAAMHVLAALGEQTGRCRELAAEYERYVASGEINSTVEDQAAARSKRCGRPTRRGHRRPAGRADRRLARRRLVQPAPSNTEPLLRLNVEAPTREKMAAGARRGARAHPGRELAIMTLDPQLLEILACPDTHHARLDYDPAAQTLTCVEVPAQLPDPRRHSGAVAGRGHPRGSGGDRADSTRLAVEAAERQPPGRRSALGRRGPLGRSRCYGWWPPAAHRYGRRPPWSRRPT